MGARQSVQQPTNRSTATRTTSTANGHAPGPSTSNALVPGTSTGNTYGRAARSYSVPGAGCSRQPDGADSSDSSAEDGDIHRIINQLPQLPPSSLFRFSTSAASSSSSSTMPTATIASRRTLPIFPFFDIKCPVCNKTVPSDEAEVHLVMCFTRPRITYNEDVLSEDKGECVICFDEMTQGDTIARLPCLCIYHKTCIDVWFKVKNSCPEHPGDD